MKDINKQIRSLTETANNLYEDDDTPILYPHHGPKKGDDAGGIDNQNPDEKHSCEDCVAEYEYHWDRFEGCMEDYGRASEQYDNCEGNHPHGTVDDYIKKFCGTRDEPHYIPYDRDGKLEMNNPIPERSGYSRRCNDKFRAIWQEKVDNWTISCQSGPSYRMLLATWCIRQSIDVLAQLNNPDHWCNQNNCFDNISTATRPKPTGKQPDIGVSNSKPSSGIPSVGLP